MHPIRLIRLTFAFAACVACATPAVPAAASPHRRGFPVAVRVANGRVVIPSRPHRIISLSPSATEDLFAIGAGHQVIAVDSDSNYPRSAPRTSLSGYEPNVEAVAADRPDLVVVVGNEGGLVTALGRLHIPVIVEPAPPTLAGAYGEIASLGRATGHRHAAQHLIVSMRQTIARTVAKARRPAHHPTYYVELDPTYYSATSTTFLGSVFSLFGLRDIADRAAGASSGYPQLSAEYIAAQNPKFIFLADTICCGQSPHTVEARPGWSRMSAVEHHRVVALNDDIASRWGPRIVTLVHDVATALERASR